MDSYTFQDFEKAADKRHFITSAIGAHEASQLYKTAVLADAYDHQRNVTIENYVQTVFTLTGNPV
ncbi:MAG: hypothetical protein IJ586_08585, partial [Alloprevotella sp.]|nr:hypothetical protein [Alloprevotella sp.]